MIETTEHHDANRTVWVVRPTRSLTWQQAKRWLCAISLIPLASGLLFLWFGVPFVLPFAGLEVALLWLAFWYVAWEGESREVVELSPGRLSVAKGRHAPSDVREFDPHWVKVELTKPGGWRPSLLRLRSHGKVTPLGEVLTDGEREWLARSLINALHKTR